MKSHILKLTYNVLFIIIRIYIVFIHDPFIIIFISIYLLL